jgi:hypothetical protein
MLSTDKLTVSDPDTINSLVTIDEVIDGHRADITKLTLEMAEQRIKYGWLVKVPGFGYDSLLRRFRNSTVQLETLLLFREDVLNHLRKISCFGVANGY